VINAARQPVGILHEDEEDSHDSGHFIWVSAALRAG
jgi:hypothetical protein